MRHPSDPIRGPDGEVVSAVDWLGNRFSVGERVLYCVGAGRGQLMAYGNVLKIFADKQVLWDHDKRCHYDGEAVRVQVLTERTSSDWGEEWSGRRSRPAMVNPLNITALPVRIK